MIKKNDGAMDVRIELVVDRFCLSMDLCHSMIFSLEKEFANIEILMSTIEPDSRLCKKLGIHVLPTWIINDKVIRINPYDYEAIKKRVHECLGTFKNK